MKNFLCVKASVSYDETKIFPSLEKYIKYCKKEDYIPSYIHENVKRVFDDSSEEEIEIQEFVDLGFIEENYIDEKLLLAQAECAVRQAKDQRESFMNGLKGTVTGCFSFGPSCVEEYVLEYKSKNKYKWKN